MHLGKLEKLNTALCFHVGNFSFRNKKQNKKIEEILLTYYVTHNTLT